MSQRTFVSIILPIRNESAYIKCCLDAVFAQDYPTKQMEILVADGMSTDDTRKIINECALQNPQREIQILDNPGKIVPTGMNIALKQAKGDIIIRVDGHTLIEPDYLAQCVVALTCSGADNVGGRMNAIGDTPFGKVVALATSTPFGIGGGRFHYSHQEEWVDTVYMGAWRYSIFEKIGLFDEELIRDQDDEFNYRLRDMGGKILLTPKIKSLYITRSSPKSLWKQYFQYGLYKVRVLQKHPRQMSLRQFVPPAFVLGLLLSMLIAQFPFSFFIPTLYLSANFIASIYTASKNGWKYLPVLPIVFSILHISYGLGFLAGLFKFWNRWGDKTGKTPSL